MIKTRVCESKDFILLPVKAQCLYFHLNCRADRQGYIENYNKLMQTLGIEDSYLNLLIAAGYLIKGNKGLVIIRSVYMQKKIKSRSK